MQTLVEVLNVVLWSLIGMTGWIGFLLVDWMVRHETRAWRKRIAARLHEWTGPVSDRNLNEMRWAL
jgi:uncharacterized membrane protein YsdA (DUF1294 family)